MTAPFKGSWVGCRWSGLLTCFVALAAMVDGKAPSGTPIRGWSSWSLSAIKSHPVYGREWLNSTNVLRQSKALQVSGLQADGYDHVNIDSFWAFSPTQIVDKYGRWTTNLTRFPDGMAVVSDTVHDRGQKLGLYVNPGVAVAAVKAKSPVEGTGCTADDIVMKPYKPANRFGDCYAANHSHPCTQAYFDSFARHLVNTTSVDFLKIDAVSPGSGETAGQYDNHEDVAAWSRALEKTGHSVTVALSWAIDASHASEFVTEANSWRVSSDVECYCRTLVSWRSVFRQIQAVRPWLNYSGNGPNLGRPDLDSLDVIMGELDGLNDNEKMTYATFWAIVGAPLYSGGDLTVADPFGVSLMANGLVLAINEHDITARPIDPSLLHTGAVGEGVWETAQGTQDGYEAWLTDYRNGTYILALFNFNDTASSKLCVHLDAVTGLPNTTLWQTVDVWEPTPTPVGAIRGGPQAAGSSLGNAPFTYTRSLCFATNAHASRLYRITAHKSPRPTLDRTGRRP